MCVSAMLLITLIVWACLGYSTSLTITNGPKVLELNAQRRFTNRLNGVTGRNNNLVVLMCPNNYRFDKLLLKCVEKERVDRRSDTSNCLPGLVGRFPNPESCRSFYNCDNGVGGELCCPNHLLFNNKTKDCDYPETADCCEYWEKDPETIVAEGVFD